MSHAFIEQLELLKTEFFRARSDAHEEEYDDPLKQDFALGEHASRVQGIVTKHLPILIDLARDDLGAHDSWGWWHHVAGYFKTGKQEVI